MYDAGFWQQISLVACWFEHENWGIDTLNFVYTICCVSIRSILQFHCIWSDFTCLVQGGVFFITGMKRRYFSHFVRSVTFCKGIFTRWMSTYCKHFTVISYLCLYHHTITVRGDTIWLYCSWHCMPDQHQERNEKPHEIAEGQQPPQSPKHSFYCVGNVIWVVWKT